MRSMRTPTRSLQAAEQQDERVFRVEVPMGEGYQNVLTNFRPIFEKSTIFVTTYEIPFSLNVEKPPSGFPAPIVKKGGKGGEIPGDVLRATTCWSQGFNAAGVTSDIAMFAGNIKYRKSIYDTTGAPWEEIVNALLSNTVERSTTVTLVFERELPYDDEEEEVAPVEPVV
eukprot:CAMPEP_0119037810 /NCGR_PEP_ID=MMETSP1177-20130426/6322_1 /TAXON_ID=2985 /ORGANISM="Ochromonas sp, Strain CCMP1899" /LENGTH=169 /DNA_ID=CAMNT_0006999519 /DNA_START=122 /DNA_END=631 /DNA_ORIENTATION=-